MEKKIYKPTFLQRLGRHVAVFHSGITGTTHNIYDSDVIVGEERNWFVSQSQSLGSSECTDVLVSQGFDLEYLSVVGGRGAREKTSSFAILTSDCRVSFPVADIYPENRLESHEICESLGDGCLTRLHDV
jgi:enhancing lycopene biosynthesis protein 2